MESTDQERSAPLGKEQIDQIIVDNRGWAESIARSVARAWSMDWQQDGLDGAAMEALIFCAKRFDPNRGVPFRGYARRRIHEASTEEARKSKNWKSGIGSASAAKKHGQAREISAQLIEIFPELRQGHLPLFDDSSGAGEDGMRQAVRGLLVGASVIATKLAATGAQPDEMVEYKRVIEAMALLEPVHQMLFWKTYWEGSSLRGVAEEWETDELNVMREHKALLQFLNRCFTKGKRLERPKVRPGLRAIALKIKRKSDSSGPFSELVDQLRTGGK